MKNIFLLLFLISGYTVFSQTVSVDALRREYEHAFKDSAACSKLYKKIIKSENSDNTTTAYRGAIATAMANHSQNKKDKLNLFNSGKKLLEQSVTADNTNIEIRFLRFTVQSNAPKVLGYNKQIESDKAFILNNYSSVTNIAIKQMIGSFAKQSTAFSETEKQKLK